MLLWLLLPNSHTLKWSFHSGCSIWNKPSIPRYGCQKPSLLSSSYQHSSIHKRQHCSTRYHRFFLLDHARYPTGEHYKLLDIANYYTCLIVDLIQITSQHSCTSECRMSNPDHLPIANHSWISAHLSLCFWDAKCLETVSRYYRSGD